MTCQLCKADFCWVCLGKWSEHGSATGGYYKCNKFEEMQKDPNFKKTTDEKDRAKHELQRYMFYYERYANHDKSARLGKELRPVIQRKIDMLHEIKSYPVSELKFLSDACLTVIQCRNVLKWTYAYGYYLDKDVPPAQRDETHKSQFEFWQTELEKHCDFLHGLVESNLDCYVDPNITDRSPFY